MDGEVKIVARMRMVREGNRYRRMDMERWMNRGEENELEYIERKNRIAEDNE